MSSTDIGRANKKPCNSSQSIDRKRSRLLLGFNPFRGNAQTERTPEIDDGTDDDDTFARVFHGFKKRAVDLDFVESKPAQINQARIPSAKVIEHHVDAERTQIDHRMFGEVCIGNDDAFGQFKLDTLRGQFRTRSECD